MSKDLKQRIDEKYKKIIFFEPKLTMPNLNHKINVLY